MARTTREAVQRVLQTNEDPDVIEEFMADAHAWVDANLSGEGIATGILSSIEKYLAAAFVTAKDPRVTRTSTDDMSDTFQRDPEVSEYLKIAAGMDPTKRLGSEFGVKGYGAEDGRYEFQFHTGHNAE